MARTLLRVLALLAVARADDAMANFKKQFPQFAGADVEQGLPPGGLPGGGNPLAGLMGGGGMGSMMDQAEAQRVADERQAASGSAPADPDMAAMMAQIRGDEAKAKKAPAAPSPGDDADGGLANMLKAQAASDPEMKAMMAQIRGDEAKKREQNRAGAAAAPAKRGKKEKVEVTPELIRQKLKEAQEQQGAMGGLGAMMGGGMGGFGGMMGGGGMGGLGGMMGGVGGTAGRGGSGNAKLDEVAEGGDIDALMGAIRDEEKAKRLKEKRAESRVRPGDPAVAVFSLDTRAESAEAAGAPVMITFLAGGKEALVTTLDAEAAAVEVDTVVGATFRARSGTDGRLLADFVVQFADNDVFAPDAPEENRVGATRPPLESQRGSARSLEAQAKVAQFQREVARGAKPPPSPPPEPPEECSFEATFDTGHDDVVALVVRGEAFRGATYDVEVLEDVGVATAELRRGLVCAPHSLELQRATAAAVMDTIVTPLTDRGVDVKIFLASYGCSGAPGVSEKTARRWWDDLAYPAKAGLDAALAALGPAEQYRSVIVTRFDVAPVAPIAAPPGAFGDAPTDYLLTDTLEAAPGAGDLAWAVPGRFLACFRATLDGCWRRDAVGSAGHDCKRHFTAFAAAVGDGQPASGFRRSWPCYLAPGRPRPPWASGSFEAADGPSELAKWQRANGYRYDPANPTAVLGWDFVCPAPRVLRRVTSASRRDSLVAEPGRELCDHLREHHAPGLQCGDDAEGFIKDELCARSSRPRSGPRSATRRAILRPMRLLNFLPVPRAGCPHATCCAQYHADHTTVPDPESLLRSRYAAFSLMLPEFLVDTAHRTTRTTGPARSGASKMSKGLEASRFTALRVKCQECKGDDEHEITFEADIQPAKQRGYGAKAVTLFERSVFRRREGVWLYAEGLDVNAETTKASR
ncbi:hypothetical protein JL722_9727 [Aureococcus anophagefferens]|nr:hypothetical protein JL722_9727 [Aureococcus anophagefferens]